MEPIINLEELNGRNGFIIRGLQRGSSVCRGVSNAGDFNGDGIDDLVFTNEGIFDDNQDFVDVLFGSEDGFEPLFDSFILDGSNGFFIQGRSSANDIGFNVNGAGDFNQDTLDDIILGSPFSATTTLEEAGEAFIIFGNTEVALSIDVENDLDGSSGIRIPGLSAGDHAGYSVSGLGDFNGDDIDDIIIGAPGAKNNTGEAYVVFGQDSFFNPTFDLQTLNGENGFLIEGNRPGLQLGRVVSRAGDINGDGVNDLVINNEESAYVLFGSQSNNFESNLNVGDLNGENGFSIEVDCALSGSFTSISKSEGVNDINQDGVDDLIIGVPSPELGLAETFILFGKNTSFSPCVSLRSIGVNGTGGEEGVAITGVARPGLDMTGFDVAAGGDLNGDDINDFLIGAPGVGAIFPNTDSGQGESYAVFGQPNLGSTFSLNSINGTNGFLMRTGNFGDRIGESITSLDIDNDTLTDVVIGAPRAAIRRPSKRGTIEESTEGACFVVLSNVEPELDNNQFFIREGEAFALSSYNLNATDLNDNDGELIFTISEIHQGFFLVDRGNNSIDTSFTIINFKQSDITNGNVLFFHDGSDTAPSFLVSVSDPRNATTSPVEGEIIFSRSSSSNTATIIGATIGSVGAVGLILAVGGGLWYRHHHNKKQNMSDIKVAHKRMTKLETNTMELGNDQAALSQSLLAKQW